MLLQFYNESALIRPGFAIGTVLRIYPTTNNLTQQEYARLCIKIDVSKSLLESFLMGSSKDDNLIVEVE